MKTRPKFNILNSLLSKLGLPFFKIALFSITLISFSVLLFLRLIKKTRRLLLHTPLKLHFPHFRVRLPKIRSVSLSLPRIKLPELNIRLALSLSLLIIISTVFYNEILRDLPDPKQLDHFPDKLTTQILDRNGRLLYKIYKDENRTLIKLTDLPQYVKDSFLTAEDKDFYHHDGFSIIGIARALYKNFTADKLEGGSTITQQLVKNTLLSNEKTITRKIKELILAFEVEKTYSKDQIFEMYLNQVGFGGPAYGIQEASRQYFNIDAKDLSLAQAAYLAGLPQAPSKYSPFGDEPQLALSRQKMILDQMYKNKFIDKQNLDQALSYPLKFSSGQIPIKAPHFVMYVKNLLTEQYGENAVEHGGFIVRTTLDLNLQELAQDTVTKEVDKLDRFHATNGAALVTDPHTGEILAMVGSKDYFDLNQDGQVNLTTSLRQPGSSIKPINYALAFENGKTPSSVIYDKPISFNIVGQGIWAPKNYDDRFHGLITLRQALASSYNIPSVILLSENGIDNFASFATKMGISTWKDHSRYGLSMALGSLEVKMTDLATAYSTFANQGVTVPLRAILSIKTPEGKELSYSNCPPQTSKSTSVVYASASLCDSQRTISPLTAYYIEDILSDPQARAPAFGINSILNIKSAKVAVKTGTSNDLRDNWAVGFTPNYLVATWVGNNDNEPMSNIASGITGASPIWAEIFNGILKDHPQPTALTPPDDLIAVSVCTLTGTLPCNGCPTRREYFVKGKEPTSSCDPQQIQQILHPSPIQSASQTQ